MTNDKQRLCEQRITELTRALRNCQTALQYALGAIPQNDIFWKKLEATEKKAAEVLRDGATADKIANEEFAAERADAGPFGLGA